MKLQGVLPALVTPFDASNNINFDAMADIIEHQLKAGVSGFVGMGTTGENYALSDDERLQVLGFLRETVGDRGTLIAGANGGCTSEVIDRIKAVRDTGYTNILVAPPYYALPSQEELINHYEQILEAVQDINVVLYNYPVRTNVEVGYDVLETFKDHERVIGIKESSGDLLRGIRIGTDYKDNYQLSCGSDDQAFDFFIWGATSWICGPANCFPDQICEFYRRFTAGDRDGAQAIMQSLFPVIAQMEEGKFIQKVKYGCELAGFNPGGCRAPLLPLTDDEKRRFRAAFEAING
ncbi:dihydrodipicolinate synthase family protein [Oceanobacter kriegii]|uniref:dihydrodipicolinate synthase family protein n=1 Tax=Oceanobacter kriegii TaxID=64972 RepID=UPI000410EAF6|nr:dihydrodipicolinate synthase family protein [Oceanobacter kriegii]